MSDKRLNENIVILKGGTLNEPRYVNLPLTDTTSGSVSLVTNVMFLLN